MAKRNLKNFILFMLVAYATAFIVEFLSAASGDSQLFQSSDWPPFFLVWYGLLYSLAYKFMKIWNLWKIGIFWSVAGPIIEIVLFRGSFLITDLFYGLMFVIPFFIQKKIIQNPSSLA